MKFTGFTQRTFSFLLELSCNNNKAFFEAHRDEYEEHVHRPLIALEEAIRDTVLSIDPLVRAGRSAVSRIYRDTRFSKDKSPFRDHMWLGYKHDGVENSQSFGFYFEITPVSYGYGLGSYGVNREFMEHFRQKILVDPARFARIAFEPEFADIFTLKGEDYQKRNFEIADESLRPWLVKKVFYVEHSSDALQNAMTGELADEIKKGFKLAEPLYRFCHDTERL